MRRFATAASVLLVSGLSIAGCASTNATSGDGAATNDVSPVSSSSSSSARNDREYPDLEAWAPTTTVTPQDLSAEEAEQLRLAALERDREWMGAADLEVPNVIAVMHGVDRDEAIAQCLSDQGFLAEPSITGGVAGTDFVEGQQEALLRANWICNGKFPLPASHYVPFDASQLAVLYEYWTEFYLPCAQAHGLEIDTSAVPTRESFVSRGLAGDFWAPSELVFQADPAQILTNPETDTGKVFYARCPHDPPSQYLYG